MRRSRRLLATGLVAFAVGLVGGCGGGSSGPSDSAAQFLILHNAGFNDGRTVRWPDLPIRVFTAGIAQQDEVTAWTQATGGTVTFAFVGNSGAADIAFAVGTEVGICAITTVEFLPDGRITRADVRVVRELFRTADCVRTVTHEVGHAIGFLGHTADGGLMDPDGGNGVITGRVSGMVRDLYLMPVGTVVSVEQRPRTALRRVGGRYTMTFTYPVRQ